MGKWCTLQYCFYLSGCATYHDTIVKLGLVSLISNLILSWYSIMKFFGDETVKDIEDFHLELARKEYGKILERKDVLGLSALNDCNDKQHGNLRDIYKKIVGLIVINPEIMHYRQLLQISQWSVSHRILTLQMINENWKNVAKVGEIKYIYIRSNVWS